MLSEFERLQKINKNLCVQAGCKKEKESQEEMMQIANDLNSKN